MPPNSEERPGGKPKFATAMILSTMRKEEVGLVDGQDPLEHLSSLILHQRRDPIIRELVGSDPSTHILTAPSLKEVCRGLVVGKGRMGDKTRRRLSGSMPMWQDHTLRFLSAIARAFPVVLEETAEQLREHSLLGAPSTLQALSITWHEGLYEMDPPKSEADLIKFFNDLRPLMELDPGQVLPAPRGGDGYRIAKDCFLPWLQGGIPKKQQASVA
jgi:hypothetical protein